jgi:hypothetical protein
VVASADGTWENKANAKIDTAMRTIHALAPPLMPSVKEGLATLRETEYRRADVCKFLPSVKKRARHSLLWKHSPQPMEMPTAPIPLSLFFFDALDPLVQRAAALTLKNGKSH